MDHKRDYNKQCVLTLEMNYQGNYDAILTWMRYEIRIHDFGYRTGARRSAKRMADALGWVIDKEIIKDQS